MGNELRSDESITKNYATQILSVCESDMSTTVNITNSSTITAAQSGCLYYLESQQTLQLIKNMLNNESNNIRNIGVAFEAYDEDIASQIETNNAYSIGVEDEDSTPVAIPCPTPTPSPSVPEG